MLQSLTLPVHQVTDAGLKELAGLKALQSLDLTGFKVTDAGLKELAGLKSPCNHWTFDSPVYGRGPEGVGRTEVNCNR